ncbi:lamin tail domain-containing protein [bacterium]|nr:lamin tail domain-containing protein [candidate division CSSED10-310 bacterium]
MKRGIALFVLLTVIGFGIADADNILSNPGFEEWTVNGFGGPPDNWTLSSSSITAIQEAAIFHSGDYSAKVTWTTTSTVNFEQLAIPVTEGSVYDFRLWVLDNDTRGYARLYGNWRNSGGTPVGAVFTGNSTDSAEWQELTALDQTAPATAVTFDYQIRFYDVGSGFVSATIYVDEVVMLSDDATPTPAETGIPTITPLPSSTPLPTYTPGEAPEVLINEVWYNDPSTDSIGFVELYGNPGTSLTGCRLQEFNQTCTLDSTLTLDGHTIPLDGYFVVGYSGTSNVDLVDADFMNSLQNGPCDGVELQYMGSRIDAVQWGTDCDPFCGETASAPEPSDDTLSLSRYPDHTDTNDNSVDFCETYPSSGGSNNSCYEPSTQIPTETPSPTPEYTSTPVESPTVTPTPLPVYGVVINEILVNPSGIDDGYEWLELYNTTGTAIDLGQVIVQSTNDVDHSFQNRLTIPGSTVIPAFGYLLIAGYNVDTGGVPPSTVIYQLTAPDLLFFQNASSHAEAVRIVTSSYSVIDTVIYSNPNVDPTPIPGDLPEDPLGEYRASLPDRDETLARCPNGTDTNYCDTDFMLRAPGYITIGDSNNCEIPTPTATPVCINNGDVNGDDIFTAGDAQLAFWIGLGTYVPTFDEECAADCNGDGEVTAADAQGIFLKGLGTGTCVDP